MFLTTKWSVKVDESARTIRSVKQNRHEYYEQNMSTSAILDFPNVALYIVKWNVLFGCTDTSLPSQENPTIWRYCIMRFFNYLFFLMAPNFLALATTLENLGARRLPAKKVNFVPWYKSWQPAKFACFSARCRRLLSLLHKSKYVEQMDPQPSTFRKLRLLKNLKETMYL